MRLLASIAMGAVLVATSACAPANHDAIDGRGSAPDESASNDSVPLRVPAGTRKSW